MQRQQKARIAAVILALLIAPIAVVISGRAQGGDTPIVIMDGSLSMDSPTPWKDFKGSGDQKSHPNTGASVTQVIVTVGGTDQPVITFSNEKCEVDILYDKTDINFVTGGNGKGLKVKPFGMFQDGGSPGHIIHKNQNAKISHVTVKKAGVKAFDQDVSGGTKIQILYK